MKKSRRSATEIRTERFNESLHPPYVQVAVHTTGGNNPKYKVFDNYDRRITSGNTLEEVDFLMNRFFSTAEYIRVD